MRVRHVLLELIKVAVGAENGAVSGIKVLVEAVCEGDGGLHVIGGWEKRSAADITERSYGGQVGRDRTGISKRCASLMIKKVDAEAGIDGCLIGIGRWAADLVQAEPAEQHSFVGNLMIDSHGKLI